MIKKTRQTSPENLWNRLARDLIYDAKQVLLYCGINVPRRAVRGQPVDYADIVDRITRNSRFGALYDPHTRRIHFEPSYIQTIIDQQSRFDFPVFDKSFGPGGIAGYIQEGDGEGYRLKNPTLNDILQQAMISKKNAMPYSFVSARQLSRYEVEQFG
jgi:hypothetical protein